MQASSGLIFPAMEATKSTAKKVTKMVIIEVFIVAVGVLDLSVFEKRENVIYFEN